MDNIAECNGKADCERHPHIRQEHPSKNVEVNFRDNQVREFSYSDEWEASEAEFEKFRSTLPGNFFDAIHQRDY